MIKRRINFQLLLFVACIGVVIYLVAAPLGFIVLSSFKLTAGQLPTEPGVPFTLHNYIRAYTSPYLYQLLLNTFIFAFGAIAIGLSFSLVFAWLVERTNVMYRNLIFALLIVPMAIPGMLSAMGWLLLLNPTNGFVNVLLRSIIPVDSGPINIYSLGGMCFLEGMRVVPTLFLMMVAVFRNMDPALEDASRTSGGGIVATLRRVTFPLATPATLAALMYVIITCLEAFEVPLVVGLTAGIPVLTTQIYLSLTPPTGGFPDYGMGSTYGMLVVVLGIILMFFYTKITKRSEKYTTVTGKGYRPRLIDLGQARYLAFGIIVLYVLLSVGLPFLALFWSSLSPFVQVPSIEALGNLSWEAYPRMIGLASSKAIINTLVISVATPVLVLTLTSIISWIIVRSRLPGRRLLDILTFLPHTIPSIVVGLGCLLLYLFIPLPIYGTVWVIVLALSARFIAFPSRVMVAAQMQIHKELEEASQVSGAPWRQTFYRIVIPLLMPAIVNGGLWVVLHSMRELAMTLLLLSNQNVVLSTLIWSRWLQGDVSGAATIGVILIVVLILLTFFGRMGLLRKKIS